MKKEEILEKSRKENKKVDEVERRIIADGSARAFHVAFVIAFLINAFEVVMDTRASLSAFAVVFAMDAVLFYYKFSKLRKKHELIVAIFNTVIAIVCITVHILGILGIGGIYGR